MKKVEIPGALDYITGERASEALDYILEQEARMNRQGAGNPYFSADYAGNMVKFYREAARLFGVQVFDGLSGREYKITGDK